MPDPALAGVDAAGGVWALEPVGWQPTGSAPGRPVAFTVIAPDPYLSATEAQISGSQMLYTGEDEVVEAPYSGESVRVRPIPWQFAELVPLATRPGTTPNNRA